MAQQSAALAEGGWRESDTSFASYGTCPLPKQETRLEVPRAETSGGWGEGERKRNPFWLGPCLRAEAGRQSVMLSPPGRGRKSVKRERVQELF